MLVIYQSEPWRAAIRSENFKILKAETPSFKVFIEKQGKARVVALAELEIPIYPKKVDEKIKTGYEVISFTEHSITIGQGMTRIVWDRDKEIFSKPYDVYE